MQKAASTRGQMFQSDLSHVQQTELNLSAQKPLWPTLCTAPIYLEYESQKNHSYCPWMIGSLSNT